MASDGQKLQKQESPAVAREDALQLMQFVAVLYWPWRLSKIDDCHLIWKGVCYFLLASGPISHRFGDMASFPLKNAHFSYRLLFIQPKIWKCFPCTASPKFCTHQQNEFKPLCDQLSQLIVQWYKPLVWIFLTMYTVSKTAIAIATPAITARTIIADLYVFSKAALFTVEVEVAVCTEWTNNNSAITLAVTQSITMNIKFLSPAQKY